MSYFLGEMSHIDLSSMFGKNYCSKAGSLKLKKSYYTFIIEYLLKTVEKYPIIIIFCSHTAKVEYEKLLEHIKCKRLMFIE